MTDIVERLRRGGTRNALELYHDRLEAADEIESLRARLAKYQTDETMINQELKDVRAKAAALGDD